MRQGAAQIDPFAQAIAQRAHRLVADRLDFQKVDDLLGSLAVLGLFAHHRAKVEKGLNNVRIHQGVPADHDVFDHGLPGEKMGALKGSRQTAARDLVDPQPRHVLSRQFHMPLLGAVEPGGHVQKRGLAGAVRPDDRKQFAVVDGDRNIVKRGHPAEFERRAAHRKRCRTGFRRGAHDMVPQMLRHTLRGCSSTQVAAAETARRLFGNVLLPAPFLYRAIKSVFANSVSIFLTYVRNMSQY